MSYVIIFNYETLKSAFWKQFQSMYFQRSTNEPDDVFERGQTTIQNQHSVIKAEDFRNIERKQGIERFLFEICYGTGPSFETKENYVQIFCRNITSLNDN